MTTAVGFLRPAAKKRAADAADVSRLFLVIRQEHLFISCRQTLQSRTAEIVRVSSQIDTLAPADWRWLIVVG